MPQKAAQAEREEKVERSGRHMCGGSSNSVQDIGGLMIGHCLSEGVNLDLQSLVLHSACLKLGARAMVKFPLPQYSSSMSCSLLPWVTFLAHVSIF